MPKSASTLRRNLAQPEGSASLSNWRVTLMRQLVFRQMEKMQWGRVTVIDPWGTQSFGEVCSRCPLHVTLHVHDPGLYRSMVFGGSIGVAESYMSGEWSVSNLTHLVRIFVINRELLDGMEGGVARLGVLLHQLFHRARRNSKSGSRRNISAHYDLGNDFYELFLDPTMMYSAAIFEHPEQSLHEASVAKLDRICQKLALSPEDRVVEIGTGWGGFALHAAQHYGCHVTTTTISQEQFRMAQNRVLKAGLEDRVTVLLQDYRDLEGTYDKLVSIEMIEAVGHEYYPQFFSKCNSLLKPDGLGLIQAITIDDRQYEVAKNTVDFIQRYIFPGGCLPSVSVMGDMVREHTDLRVTHLEDLTRHYALTLKHWRQCFLERLDDVRALGYSEEFIRMWEYYFCYCEGGFQERFIGVVHMMLAKPWNRQQEVLPPLS